MSFSYLMVNLRTGKIAVQDTDIYDFIESAMTLAIPDYKKNQTNAHTIIKRIIDNGFLPKAKDLGCYYCGKQAKDWHHPCGYSNGFEDAVIPVCDSCHKAQTKIINGLKSKLDFFSENGQLLPFDNLQKMAIEIALQKSFGSKSKAAKMLGITRRRLYSLMESFKIGNIAKRKCT